MSEEARLVSPEAATAGAVAHAAMGLIEPLAKVLANLLHELVRAEAITAEAVERSLDADSRASDDGEPSTPFEMMQKNISRAFMARLRTEIQDRASTP